MQNDENTNENTLTDYGGFYAIDGYHSIPCPHILRLHLQIKSSKLGYLQG